MIFDPLETRLPGAETTAAIDPGRVARRKLIDRGLQVFGIGTFYVAVLIFFSVSAPRFLEYSNATAILSNVSVIGIVAIGQALAIISGGFDLSVSGVIPLAAVAYAAFTNGGFAVPLCVLLVVLIGAGVGLANGLIVTKIGINPLITTLGTLSIAAGLAFTISGGVTAPFESTAAGVWGNTAFGDIQYGVIALVFLGVAGFFVMRYSVFGRALYAIGGNREASRLAGIRVDLVTVSVYMISGGLAGFGGVVVSSQLLAGSATVGADATLSSIAAVVLGGAALTGGVGGIPGTLLGVLILGTIANGMVLMQVPAFYQQIATGGVLLLAVGFGRLRTVLGGMAR